MLFSSLIVLFAASSFVSGLPTSFRRDVHGVASVPGPNALANIPRADATVAPPDTTAGHKTKADEATTKKKEDKKKGDKKKGDKKKGDKKKGDKKKGHKHAKDKSKAASSTGTAADTADAAATDTADAAAVTDTADAAVTDTADAADATVATPTIADEVTSSSSPTQTPAASD